MKQLLFSIISISFKWFFLWTKSWSFLVYLIIQSIRFWSALESTTATITWQMSLFTSTILSRAAETWTSFLKLLIIKRKKLSNFRKMRQGIIFLRKLVKIVVRHRQTKFHYSYISHRISITINRCLREKIDFHK